MLRNVNSFSQAASRKQNKLIFNDLYSPKWVDMLRNLSLLYPLRIDWVGMLRNPVQRIVCLV